MPRAYAQNCPITIALDILGERWTLLILAELVGGARRYVDLRQSLPAIATNLLAERLRGLNEAGLISRVQLPEPAARTVYALSDSGWRRVLPVLRALAHFGLADLCHEPSAATPLNGFLAGILLGVDDHQAAGIDASYRFHIDGRTFDIRLHRQRFDQMRGAPAVTTTATAADLIIARFGPTAVERKAALGKVEMVGQPDALKAMRCVFRLVGDPGFASAA